MTLLLERPIHKAGAFAEWVADVGGPSTADEWKRWDPHVTIIYSRADAPWPTLLEMPYGVTAVPFEFGTFANGHRTAIVLGEPDHLLERHAEMLALGHVTDYPTYRPHVTLWENRTPRLPFAGLIYFGGERAREIGKKARAKRADLPF